MEAKQVRPPCADSAEERVQVAVGQTRHDGFPRQIDYASIGTLKFFSVRIRADESDASIFGCERFRVRRAFVARVNIPVGENGRLGAERGRGGTGSDKK